MMNFLKYNLVFLFILLVGTTGILLLYTQQGIGLTHDSGFYVYAGCYDFMHEPTGKVLSIFPPLYPALVGLFHATGVAPLTCAMLLNLLAYFLLAWGIKLTGEEQFNTHLYKNIFYAVTLLGTPILVNAYMLWSEMLFISLLWFSLQCLTRAIQQYSFRNYLFFSLLFFLCLFTRYAAIGLLPGLYLVLTLNFRKHKMNAYLTVLFFTGIIPALWLSGNYIAGNGIPYDAATLSLTDNLWQNTEAFSHFLLPDKLPDLIASISLILVLLVLVIRYKSIRTQSYLLHLAVILSYTIFLIILNSIKNIQIPDERYYSILYPSLILVLLISLENFQENLSPVIKGSIAVAICLWMIYPMARSFKNTRDFIQHGIGYQDEKWRNNRLIKEARSLEGTLISNNPLPFILFGNRGAITHTASIPADLQNAYLLWWKKEGLDYLPDDQTVWRKNYNFEPIDSTDDGALYRLRRK